MNFCTFSDSAWVHHNWRRDNILKNRLTLSTLALKVHTSWQNWDACVGMSKNRPGSRKELICWGSSAAPGMECMGASFSKKANTDVHPSIVAIFCIWTAANPLVSDLTYNCPPIMKGEVPSFQRTNLCIPSVCIPAPLTESRPETSLREQSPTALHFVSHCHTETWHCHITAMKMS